MWSAVASFTAFAASFVFQPPTPSYTSDAWENQLFFLKKSNGETFPALLIEPVEHRDPGFTVLYSHGNAEDLDGVVPIMKANANRWGVCVLVYDYSGYGLSTSRIATEADCNEEVALCFGHLTQERGIPGERIVIMGRSLGSGPAIHLAYQLTQKNVPFGGLVTVSAFTSCLGVANRYLEYSPINLFDNLSKIKHIKRPSLFFHGLLDKIVAVSHGELLQQACGSNFKFLVKLRDSGHNDVYSLYPDTILRELNVLFEYIDKEQGIQTPVATATDHDQTCSLSGEVAVSNNYIPPHQASVCNSFPKKSSSEIITSQHSLDIKSAIDTPIVTPIDAPIVTPINIPIDTQTTQDSTTTQAATPAQESTTTVSSKL